MAGKKAYESPEVGTIFPLSSVYAEGVYAGLVKKIADILAEKALIPEYMKPEAPSPVLLVKFNEYINKIPTRKHISHWIDGGNQIAVFHPETFIPFFFNSSASKIIKMCNGKTKIGELLKGAKKDKTPGKADVVVRDLMRFILLLEELDLIEFAE